MKGGEKIRDELRIVLVTILSTGVLIMLGFIYFALTLFVIKIASDAIFAISVDTNWAVLAAALITLGSMLGGALEKKRISA